MNLFNMANDLGCDPNRDILLVFGGTGSIGRYIVRDYLKNQHFHKIICFSRDEQKHFAMANELEEYVKSGKLESVVGDIRDYNAVKRCVDRSNYILNAASMKHVPLCEKFPEEAFKTNVEGLSNILGAVEESKTPLKCFVNISSDKACEPINVMGMTKALQEKMVAERAHRTNKNLFCVRYGNVFDSMGSFVDVLQKNFLANKPTTVTNPGMTRFFISKRKALECITDLIQWRSEFIKGSIYVPKLRSMTMRQLATAFTKKEMYGEKLKLVFSETNAIRPGEKIHEVLISRNESYRTKDRGSHFIIRPSIGFPVDEYGSSGYMGDSQYCSNMNEALIAEDECQHFIFERVMKNES